MPTTYQKCDEEVISISRRIIKQHHKELRETETRVAYLFAESQKDQHGDPLAPAVTVGGYPCAAKVKVIGLKERVDGRADAEVIIDVDTWKGMSDPEKDSLIDHELFHLEVKTDPDNGDYVTDDLGRPKLKLRKHDHQFGWFNIIAEQHGDASFEVKQAKVFADNHGQTYFGRVNPPASAESLPAASADDSEVTSVTLSGAGRSMTLTGDSQKRADKMLKQMAV
jgi:hypothetical protein